MVASATQIPGHARYLLLVLDGDVDAQLPAAWQDARLCWDDPAAHDRLLALARQHDGYVWLATRYRKLAVRGDAVAQHRLALLQRLLELTLMFRPVETEEPRSYRSVTRMLAMLAMLLALGFVFLKQVMRTREPAASTSGERLRERGSALLVVMLVTTALMAGMATLTAMQTSATRAVGISHSARTALYCAEAGLAAARTPLVGNWPSWNAALAAGTEPSWFASIDHDLDDDGVSDFTLTLEDNQDEIGSNDGTRDNDLTVFVVSTCTKYPETPVQLVELVRYNGGGSCYQAQLGGCGGNNNAN